ncbi:MAG: hypothetical protein HN368_07910 [Spirochaetales bacterium]|jgi:hypothetical protein|nr:hypothetical protein [Spirochaetales bacterium]
MVSESAAEISSIVGTIPYRMAFAGGWIDQPFVSRLNPTPPGSMVVVAIEADCRFMDRCGMGTSTRRVAHELWPDGLPDTDPAELTKELYRAENKDLTEPSGSQDMIGLLYPGINRIDYDYSHEEGIFPVHVDSCTDRETASWLEKIIYMIPINQRPAGYNPLEVKNLDGGLISRLGKSGQDCYEAIISMNASALGESMNECMECWEAILPNTVSHSTIALDLRKILAFYQNRYAGAMYSGCGGGYLYVVSDEPVPGGFPVRVRTRRETI